MFDERFHRRGNALCERLGDDADPGVLVARIALAQAITHVGHEAVVGDAHVAHGALFAHDERGGSTIVTVMGDGGDDVAAGENVSVPDHKIGVLVAEQARDIGQAAAGFEDDRFMHELHFGFAELTFGEGLRPDFGAVMRVDDKAARAGGAEFFHGLQDHRSSGDRQQGLGAVLGERAQAGA